MSTAPNISKILNNPAKVTKIIQNGINAALLKHKQAGNQVCEWRDNKVVWIPSEQIIINKYPFFVGMYHLWIICFLFKLQVVRISKI